jgi:nucleotide-binding universal stress UspA family protein
MKILLAIDGSSSSRAAVEEVTARPWPADTEVKVLSVAHAQVPEIFDPFFLMYAAHEELIAEERKHAPKRVEDVVEAIRKKKPELRIEGEVREGNPKRVIVEEAERWNADLVLIGSHGYGKTKRILLGSVSQAVVQHAPCSVEVVRQHDAA